MYLKLSNFTLKVILFIFLNYVKFLILIILLKSMRNISQPQF